jgi:regulator of CtrA degradation
MGSAAPIFLNKLYDESFGLLIEARNYFSHHPSAKAAMTQTDAWDSLYVNLQAMRLTTRMTQAMAWLLAQRALQEGELSLQEACGGDYSLGAQEICLDREGHNDNRVPPSMQKLLNRSHELYLRVLRLDQMARDKVSTTLQ